MSTLAPAATSRAERILARFGGYWLFVLIPVVVTIAAEHPTTRPLLDWLCSYSPERFVHGRVWTLPASAFLVPHLTAIGPTMILTVAILLPFVLLRGLWETVVVFFSGHIVSTLMVLAVTLPGAALGIPWLQQVYFARDVGASAGLTAAAGALAVFLSRAHPEAGAAIGAGVIGFLVVNALLHPETAGRVLADVEHALAFLTGCIVEWRMS